MAAYTKPVHAPKALQSGHFTSNRLNLLSRRLCQQESSTPGYTPVLSPLMHNNKDRVRCQVSYDNNCMTEREQAGWAAQSPIWQPQPSVHWARNRSPSGAGSPYWHLDGIPQAQFRYNHVSTTNTTTNNNVVAICHRRVRQRHVLTHEID